jgi:phytanoyl-CoA hydroxylase
MARDGQLSHNVRDFTEEIQKGSFGDRTRERKWLVGNYEAGDVVFHNP